MRLLDLFCGAGMAYTQHVGEQAFDYLSMLTAQKEVTV